MLDLFFGGRSSQRGAITSSRILLKWPTGHKHGIGLTAPSVSGPHLDLQQYFKHYQSDQSSMGKRHKIVNVALL